MIIDLSGKRAIVTGSTSGIGFAIVRGLASAGAAVLINGRSRDKVKAAQHRLEKEVPGYWHRFFDTNVMSGVRLSRHYLPTMLARGWGRLVFISSESALNIPVEMIHYGMTKTAQLAISRGLAESVAGTAITVNAVVPGPTRSEGVADFFGKLAKEQGVSEEEMEAQFIARNRPTSLLRRLATPEEVANMVVYVCSPQASATTGAALRVDGGVVRAIA